MVYRFLEKEEIPKPTIALDYSFGRKAGKSLVSFFLLREFVVEEFCI